MEKKTETNVVPESRENPPRPNDNAPDLDVDKERHAEEQVLRDEPRPNRRQAVPHPEK